MLSKLDHWKKPTHIYPKLGFDIRDGSFLTILRFWNNKVSIDYIYSKITQNSCFIVRQKLFIFNKILSTKISPPWFSNC